MDLLQAFWRSIPYVTPLAILGEFLLYYQGHASLFGLLFVLISGAFTLSVYLSRK